MSSATSRPGSSAALALLLAALTLVAATACGSDSEGSGGDAAAAGTTSSSGFEPFTVEHAYGSTEITEEPQRVVSLDNQWTDVLVALDQPPVAYIGDPGAPDGFPWREDLLADATELTGTTALPFEEIAALEPDLIVITFYATSQEDYDLLSGIAPTVTTLGDGAVDKWQDIAEVAGRMHGEPEAAAALVEEVDAEVEAVSGALPALEGATFAFANYVPGDAFYVLTDPADGANVLFTQLGLVTTDELAEAGAGSGGRVKTSFEEISLLGADLLFLLTNGADPATIPGYDQLPAVQSGAVALMDYDTAVALNTPSPLSVPFGLAAIRPALDSAAA